MEKGKQWERGGVLILVYFLNHTFAVIVVLKRYIPMWFAGRIYVYILLQTSQNAWRI